VDTYVARCTEGTSVSFLISARSPRSHCLIVPRRADVSAERMDSLVTSSRSARARSRRFRLDTTYKSRIREPRLGSRIPSCRLVVSRSLEKISFASRRQKKRQTKRASERGTRPRRFRFPRRVFQFRLIRNRPHLLRLHPPPRSPRILSFFSDPSG